MGPPSYMRSVVDWNAVMRRIPVRGMGTFWPYMGWPVTILCFTPMLILQQLRIGHDICSVFMVDEELWLKMPRVSDQITAGIYLMGSDNVLGTTASCKNLNHITAYCRRNVIHVNTLWVPMTVHREQSMKTEKPTRCNN